MRACFAALLASSGCATTVAVVDVRDPFEVALEEAGTGRELIGAGAPPLTQATLEHGLVALRGEQGQLLVNCPRCRVDDRKADGIWVFSDGSTEDLPVRAAELASQRESGDLRIPVSASRATGPRSSLGTRAVLVTPFENVRDIREVTRVPRSSEEGTAFEGLAAILLGTLAGTSFGETSRDASPAGRTIDITFGTVFTVLAVATLSWTLWEPHRRESQHVVWAAPEARTDFEWSR
jgi:hypothetical protein